MVLTNPPFGRKQGYKIVGDDGEIESEREEYNRPDFIKIDEQQATELPSTHHVRLEGERPGGGGAAG